MGILHKLVFILGKLDPHNVRWKARQLSKAYEISDITIRENTIADIERAFQKNELDYGRKLFLIQNCIYGVDIQPIAVQIAKLRFFISLLVDQKADRKETNFGIIPLPNLETKFVAANTLIGIKHPVPKTGKQESLRSPDIIAKEKLLHEVRDRHFNARTPATKNKYREEDANLRAEIAALLKTDGYGSATAQMLADWDPYDQEYTRRLFRC
jgi:hypothetical protein